MSTQNKLRSKFICGLFNPSSSIDGFIKTGIAGDTLHGNIYNNGYLAVSKQGKIFIYLRNDI